MFFLVFVVIFWERIFMYEIFELLLKKHGVTTYQVAKATGISTASFTGWKQGKWNFKSDKLKKIADYFGVTVDYLMTGSDDEPKEKDPELTTKDRRDIAKDLDRIMTEIQNGDDGPLYYNGNELDEASLALLNNAIEYALTQAKKENKVKYNPHKNKK